MCRNWGHDKTKKKTLLNIKYYFLILDFHFRYKGYFWNFKIVLSAGSKILGVKRICHIKMRVANRTKAGPVKWTNLLKKRLLLPAPPHFSSCIPTILNIPKVPLTYNLKRALSWTCIVAIHLRHWNINYCWGSLQFFGARWSNTERCWSIVRVLEVRL